MHVKGRKLYLPKDDFCYIEESGLRSVASQKNLAQGAQQMSEPWAQ